MVWPIVDEADVFFVLDDATPGRAGARADRGEEAARAAVAAEARRLWRPVYDLSLQSRGLEESLVACRGVIEAREAARRRAYDRRCGNSSRAEMEISTSRPRRRRDSTTGISTSRPRRRRDSTTGISTSRPRRRRDPRLLVFGLARLLKRMTLAIQQK